MWLYLLKNKSEAYVFFQEFQSLVKQEFGKCIKTFQTKNVGEYTKHEFATYLSNNGVQHQMNIPYTPQYNGLLKGKKEP